MIEIKITGTTPLEALASVTAFGMHCMKNQAVHGHPYAGGRGEQSVQIGHGPDRAHGSCGTRCIGSGKPYTCACSPGKPCTGPRGCCSGSWPPGDAPW